MVQYFTSPILKWQTRISWHLLCTCIRSSHYVDQRWDSCFCSFLRFSRFFLEVPLTSPSPFQGATCSSIVVLSWGGLQRGPHPIFPIPCEAILHMESFRYKEVNSRGLYSCPMLQFPYATLALYILPSTRRSRVPRVHELDPYLSYSLWLTLVFWCFVRRTFRSAIPRGKSLCFIC